MAVIGTSGRGMTLAFTPWWLLAAMLLGAMTLSPGTTVHGTDIGTVEGLLMKVKTLCPLRSKQGLLYGINGGT